MKLLPMNPQPPVTKRRIAARTSSDKADVKRGSHKDHEGHSSSRQNENDIAKPLSAVYVKQLLTQLRLGGLKPGLLINFGEAHLRNGIKRVINGEIEPIEGSDLVL
jgi:hypothetical protein